MPKPFVTFILALLLTLSGGLLLQSCGDIFGDLNNRFDPDSPNYIPPDTEIFTGPAEGATIDTADVIFAWRHSNELMWPDTAYDYSSRILYSFRFGYSAWTDWMSGEMLPDYNIPNQKYNSATGIHTLELHSLEDGQHRFEVRSKYPSDIEEDKWPVRLFSVDALDGTALIVSPGYIYLDSGSSFIISIKAVDVTDLLGFRLVLKYDPGMLMLDEYSIKTEVSDLLGLSSGEILEFISTDGQNGIFDVNIAVAGGTVTGITGSGILARIRFAHTGRTGSTEIKIAPESTLRDVYNNDILNVRQGGQVIVW